MRRPNAALAIGLALIAVLAVAPAWAQSTTSAPAIRVSPGTGTQKTHVAVSFMAPARTGSLGVMTRHDVLVVTGPAHPRGCIHAVDLPLADSAIGATERVVLNPSHLGGKWCVGTSRGQIEVIGGPECPVHTACPALVEFQGTIGRFSFHVKRPATKTTHG